jgi:molybdopterin-containing oxidoreductase family iron-sulfur binding subunit
MDFARIRSRLAKADGPTYWRSLEELADTPEFQELLHREFPENASTFTDPVGRRQFLKLMSASLALAGVGACTRQPAETIIPYARQPEELVPGKPLFYASAMPFGGYASPVLVESHEGRPTKVEGNPDHPASLGAADAFTQASILNLYDPDRMQTITSRGEVRTWSDLMGDLRNALTMRRAQGGAGLHIVTETMTSPSTADLLNAVVQAMPQAKWHQWEPTSRNAAREGARAAFGRDLDTVYHFDKADVIVALDSDFLSCGPGSVRYQWDFAGRRKVENGPLTRLYAIETMLSATGIKADHRLQLKPSQIDTFARALAAALGVGAAGATGLPGEAAKWVTVLAKDLRAHNGRAVVVPGDDQPPAVHVLAHAMNEALGAVGTTVTYVEPIEAKPVNQVESIRELAKDLESGAAQVLIILGGNPAFNAPADLKLAEKLTRAELIVYLGPDLNETAQLAHWNIPEAHYLESWGDVRAFDGTVSIIQPLIAPLYGGRTAAEVLALLSDRPDRNAHDIVKDYWTAAFGGQATTTWTIQNAEGGSFASADQFWRHTLHDGLIRGTQALPVTGVAANAAAAGEPPQAKSGVEVIFRPDPTVWDGRFANNGWLQELPKPVTKLTWDTAAYLAPATADRMGIERGEMLELRSKGRSVRMPAMIVPGQAPDTITLHYGYGRRLAGRVGANIGFDAYPLRGSDAMSFDSVEVVRTNATYPLATTQQHFLMEDRDIVRVATAEEYAKDPHVIKEKAEAPPKTLTLYPEYEYKGHKWGMAIDVSTCTGCNACIVACQSENNSPIVGKEQVLASREMQWLRVDMYYSGHPDNPEGYYMPVPCMQCENAPCEVVCPVAATTHSAEGLNDMVYNRCVGTRYCSNNCPYKVRRFNFTLYQDWYTPSLQGARNPDVTIRSRGVMEKCTYCVQRISQARIEAKKEDREIRDGDVLTACQATCPSQAIVFGDINDPNSKVAQLKAQQRNYGLLEELNTRPRTTYLAAIRNPNPELEPAPASRASAGSGRGLSSDGGA